MKAISTDAFSQLMRFRWSGNVRELENAIEHAVLHCVGEEITVSNLPAALREDIAEPNPDFPLHWTLADVEKHAIVRALERAGRG